MTKMKANTITLTVEEYKKMIDADSEMRSKNAELTGTVGELRNEIAHLRTKVSKLEKKEKNPDEYILKSVFKKRDRWGDDYVVEENVSIVGLDSVKEMVRGSLNKDLISKNKKLEEKIHELQVAIIQLERERDIAEAKERDANARVRREVNEEHADEVREYEKRIKELREEMEDEESKYRRQIKALKDEMKAIEERRTLEDLEKLREEQIKALEAELEAAREEVAIASAQGWLTRFVNNRKSNKQQRITRRKLRGLKNTVASLENQIQRLYTDAKRAQNRIMGDTTSGKGWLIY